MRHVVVEVSVRVGRIVTNQLILMCRLFGRSRIWSCCWSYLWCGRARYVFVRCDSILIRTAFLFADG